MRYIYFIFFPDIGRAINACELVNICFNHDDDLAFEPNHTTAVPFMLSYKSYSRNRIEVSDTQCRD